MMCINHNKIAITHQTRFIVTVKIDRWFLILLHRYHRPCNGMDFLNRWALGRMRESGWVGFSLFPSRPLADIILHYTLLWTTQEPLSSNQFEESMSKYGNIAIAYFRSEILRNWIFAFTHKAILNIFMSLLQIFLFKLNIIWCIIYTTISHN